MADGKLAPACTGDYCGVNGDAFSGSGWGIWAYENVTEQSVEVPIQITGLNNDRVTVVFTNASAKQQTLAGDLEQRATAYYANESSDTHLDAQIEHIETFTKPKVVRDMLTHPPKIVRKSDAQQTEYYDDETVTYQINTEHTWKSAGFDAQDVAKIYDVPATLLAKSTTSDGSTLYVWVEKNSSVAITQDSAKDFAAVLLKVYDTVTGLTQGKPWGPHNGENLIPATTKDIHFLFQDMTTKGMGNVAGFFDPACVYTNQARDNQALIIFVNGILISTASTDPQYSRENVISTLAHELTHMINFYERAVTMGESQQFAEWLEEATALATEDIVSPILFPATEPNAAPRFHAFRDIRQETSHIMIYACNLTEYSKDPSALLCTHSSLYPNGSSFMAFMLRHYGVEFFRKLLKSRGQSLDAIQAALRDSHGTNVDRWEVIMRRWGSILSLMPGDHIPADYGLPERISEGFRLIGLSVPDFIKKWFIRLAKIVSLDVFLSGVPNLPEHTMLPYSHGIIVDDNQTGTYQRKVTIPSGVSVAVYVNASATV